jgi:biopolymer transport protein ExbD
MKQSFRAKRMVKQNQRLGQVSKLNLVALMDIFTILVFFLMVNQSEVKVLQSDTQLALPHSAAEQLPAETAVLTVHPGRISLQGKAIWQGDLTADATTWAPALERELTAQLAALALQSGPLPASMQATGRSITLLGDATVPYALLKRLLAVCAATEYRNVSLAVELQAGSATQVAVP